jgi:hypothetical protein
MNDNQHRQVSVRKSQAALIADDTMDFLCSRCAGETIETMWDVCDLVSDACEAAQLAAEELEVAGVHNDD